MRSFFLKSLAVLDFATDHSDSLFVPVSDTPDEDKIDNIFLKGAANMHMLSFPRVQSNPAREHFDMQVHISGQIRHPFKSGTTVEHTVSALMNGGPELCNVAQNIASAGFGNFGPTLAQLIVPVSRKPRNELASTTD